MRGLTYGMRLRCAGAFATPLIRPLVFGGLLLTAACTPPEAPPSMEQLTLKPGEVAVIGYGSLTSKESMQRTLGHEYNGRFMTVELANWQRNWQVAMPNDGEYRRFYALSGTDTIVPQRIAYLNISPSPGDTINACLFVIDSADIRLFDLREWIYSRVDVTRDLVNVSVRGGSAYAYQAKPEFMWHTSQGILDVAVRRSYVAILDSAFMDLGANFKARFHETTQDFSDSLMIEDRRFVLQP